MSLYEISTSDWAGPISAEKGPEMLARLERGDVMVLPQLRLAVTPPEQALFDPAILASAKNASFDPHTGRLSGTTLDEGRSAPLVGLMRRFSDSAASLVSGLLPRYAPHLVRGRASFRPAEIAGRATSWRKDR